MGSPYVVSPEASLPLLCGSQVRRCKHGTFRGIKGRPVTPMLEMLSTPMRGQISVLRPTAPLLASFSGVLPCLRYDQKGSVTCAESVKHQLRSA